MKRKNPIIIIVLIVVLLFIFAKSCFIPIVNWVNFNHLDQKESATRVAKGKQEYLSLFGKKKLNDLSIYQIFVSKENPIIISFNYKMDYTIIVHELIASKKSVFDSLLNIDTKKDIETSLGIYQGYSEGDFFDFKYSSHNDPKIEKIFFTHNGKMIHNFKLAENLISVQFTTRKLGVKYSKNADYSMLLSLLDRDLTTLSMDASVLKIGEKLYMFLSFARENHVSIKPNFIKDLIDEKLILPAI